MFPYLPHTKDQIQEMLDILHVNSINDLFTDIPNEIKQKAAINIPDGLSEYEVFKQLCSTANRNIEKPSFLGFGSYDHIIPAAVGHILSRSEFYTAYTPYQAEISQGILQAVFEFQTLICQLTDMDASNASLYDTPTAASEAAAMALNSVRNSNTILYSETIHPSIQQVLKTRFSYSGISLQEIKHKHGVLSVEDLKSKLNSKVAAVIVQTPNVFGYTEDYTGIADLVHENNSLFIISSNPLSLGILKSQGEWGSDIAVGDTQSLGLPVYFGGPYAGYIAVKGNLLRKMPGRIAGESVDSNGKRAFLLTLQAREQHIRRERAASNICSNQALCALATTVHLAAIGKKGLTEVCRLNFQKAHYLFERLTHELPVRALYNNPFFNEFSVMVDKAPEEILKEMENAGFYAGVPLGKYYQSRYKNAVCIAVTEKRTKEDMDKYIDVLKRILQ